MKYFIVTLRKSFLVLALLNSFGRVDLHVPITTWLRILIATVLLKIPPLKVRKPDLGRGVFIFLKIWAPKKLRGVFIFFQISKILTRILIFLKTKKSRIFSVSPLRNPFLVPKRPQNFLRRFAPIRGVSIFLKIWAPKKWRGVFIFSEILQKSRRGFLLDGGFYF